MPTIAGQVFGKSICAFCGRAISHNGLAQYQHHQKHLREGLTWDTPEGQAAMKRVKEQQAANKEQAQ